MLAVRREILRAALNGLDTMADLAAALEAACILAAEKVCDQLDLIPSGVRERHHLLKES